MQRQGQATKKTKSNYARKREFLASCAGAAPNARVWGFDFAMHEKKWRR